MTACVTSQKIIAFDIIMIYHDYYDINRPLSPPLEMCSVCNQSCTTGNDRQWMP